MLENESLFFCLVFVTPIHLQELRSITLSLVISQFELVSYVFRGLGMRVRGGVCGPSVGGVGPHRSVGGRWRWTRGRRFSAFRPPRAMSAWGNVLWMDILGTGLDWDPALASL